MTLTLRNLPPEVERAVMKRARENGTSASRAVVQLLEEATGTGGKKKRGLVHHDLDALFRSMSEHEAAELQKAVLGQRTVDRELWK